MFIDFVMQLNWVDILVLTLLFRICYIAVQTGILIELFKFLGITLSLYFSLHYYTTLGDFMKKSLNLKAVPLEFLDFLSFIFIAGAIYLIIVGVRNSFLEMLKVEAKTTINKWGGLAVGGLRSLFLIGVVMYMLAISSVQYVKTSVGSSYLGRKFFNVAPAVYSALWNGVGSKFMINEKFNKNVDEVKKSLRGKRK